MPSARSREVADRMSLVGEWRDQQGNVELYGDRRPGHRDGVVLIVTDTGVTEAATITGGASPDIRVTWTADAAARYDRDWLDRVEARVRVRLAYAWGAI